MDWNRKKRWGVLATSLLAFTSLLHSDDSTQMRNLENRVSSLEQRKGSKGMINPPARPMVTDGMNIGVQVDVLIWQASENGLGYGIKNNGGTTFANDGDVLSPQFDWDWGFKLGLNYDLSHDGWDVLLQWTRFVTDNGTHTANANAGGAIFPSFYNTPAGATVVGFTSASEHWKLRLNLIDLELGREFYVSRWLSLRPHAGLRNAWIQQNYRVNYLNSISFSNGNGSFHIKNNFWGLGLRGGIDGNWGLGAGWSLYSDFALAILLGHFHVAQSSVVGPTTGLDSHYRASAVTGDWAAGFRYRRLFGCERYGFTMQIGWEQHMFFSQNQMLRYFGTPPSATVGGTVSNSSGMFVANQGDLTTQGVTFTLKLDF